MFSRRDREIGRRKNKYMDRKKDRGKCTGRDRGNE
jgi:hypothetical protein